MYKPISEREHKKFRPKQQMGGPVFKNGKDVSKAIEKQTARKQTARQAALKAQIYK